MKKRILYVFVRRHDSHVTTFSILAAVQSMADDQLIDAYQPSKLSGEYEAEFRMMLRNGYNFSNWHVVMDDDDAVVRTTYLSTQPVGVP